MTSRSPNGRDKRSRLRNVQKPVCPECGSGGIAMDAAVRWSGAHQRWEVTSVFEGGCDDCDAQDITPKWVEARSNARRPAPKRIRAGRAP
jgi:hypothetical protein